MELSEIYEIKKNSIRIEHLKSECALARISSTFILLVSICCLIEVNCAVRLTSTDYQFFMFFFVVFSCSDAFLTQRGQRRRSLIKAHVRSSRNLHFDDNFADTREIAELEDHNSNSKGN